MKLKLIKELLGVLTGVKESNNDITLDINDENKESVYSELLIPLMNLTNSDTVEALHNKLDFLINGNVDSDEFVEFANYKIIPNQQLDKRRLYNDFLRD